MTNPTVTTEQLLSENFTAEQLLLIASWADNLLSSTQYSEEEKEGFRSTANRLKLLAKNKVDTSRTGRKLRYHFMIQVSEGKDLAPTSPKNTVFSDRGTRATATVAQSP